MSNVGSVDRSVRVVNLSAVGIGAERQRLRLEEALGYEPDLVILHVHGSNEYEDYRDHLYLENLHRGLGGLVLQSRFAVLAKKFLSRRFALAETIQVARDTPGGERRAGRDPEKAALFRATLRRHTEGMLAAMRARKLPVIVGTRRAPRRRTREREPAVSRAVAGKRRVPRSGGGDGRPLAGGSGEALSGPDPSLLDRKPLRGGRARPDRKVADSGVARIRKRRFGPSRHRASEGASETDARSRGAVDRGSRTRFARPEVPSA
jgi:hypothetical protein